MTIDPVFRQRIRNVPQYVGTFGRDVGHGFGSEVSNVRRDVVTIAQLIDRHGAVGGVRLLRNGMNELGPGQGIRDTLLDTFVRPTVADFDAGKPGQAVGRISFHLLTSVIPADKLVRSAAAIAARSMEVG